MALQKWQIVAKCSFPILTANKVQRFSSSSNQIFTCVAKFKEHENPICIIFDNLPEYVHK